MEDKKIITNEEELLERSEEIDPRKDGKTVKSIILEIKNVIRHQNIVALAAPQIGYKKRIVALNFGNDIKTFVNPLIVKCEDFTLTRETSCSIPDKVFLVPRYNKIEVNFQTATGKIQSYTLLGFAAYQMQQCIDYLEGVFISDIGMQIDKDFDSATDDEKQEIIKLFLDSIDSKLEEVNGEISNDEELHQLSEGIRFIQSVNRGETVLEPIESEQEHNE